MEHRGGVSHDAGKKLGPRSFIYITLSLTNGTSPTTVTSAISSTYHIIQQQIVHSQRTPRARDTMGLVLGPNRGSNGIPRVFPEDRRTELKTEQDRVTEMTESAHVTKTTHTAQLHAILTLDTTRRVVNNFIQC